VTGLSLPAQLLPYVGGKRIGQIGTLVDQNVYDFTVVCCRCIEQGWIRQAGEQTMEFSEFSTQKLLQATGQSEHLTDREKHLIGLAVTTTRGCIACTGNRLKRALEAGVSYETLVAGIDVAAAVNAGVTVAIATQGAERNGIVKPELSCADEACAVGLPRS
jgi:alkylhydroperoxidase/carboxymuconolactone decarboxylase family protein YurZ